MGISLLQKIKNFPSCQVYISWINFDGPSPPFCRVLSHFFSTLITQPRSCPRDIDFNLSKGVKNDKVPTHQRVKTKKRVNQQQPLETLR